MNDERAAEGLDHLQRAAREMVAAARSFLDVVEELVEDRSALAEAAATVTGLAGAVTDAVRGGLGGRGPADRPEPWETAAWGDPPFEHDVADVADVADEDDEDDRTAAGADAGTAADAADGAPDPAGSGGGVVGNDAGVADLREQPRRPSRVRRIAVD
jgi:hypothetical protein